MPFALASEPRSLGQLHPGVAHGSWPTEAERFCLLALPLVRQRERSEYQTIHTFQNHSAVRSKRPQTDRPSKNATPESALPVRMFSSARPSNKSPAVMAARILRVSSAER